MSKFFVFNVAAVEENQLPELAQWEEIPKEIQYKTIYVVGKDENEALGKAETYLAKTQYKTIKDRSIIR